MVTSVCSILARGSDEMGRPGSLRVWNCERAVGHCGRGSRLSAHSWGSQDAHSTTRLWRRLSVSPARRSSETSSGCTGQSRPHFRQHHAMITALPWMVVSAVTQPTAAQKTHRAGMENRSSCDTRIAEPRRYHATLSENCTGDPVPTIGV